MTLEQALIKIIETQDRLIKELTLKSTTTVTLPYIATVCDHQYPTPWHGTVAPSCIKCGHWQPSVITFSSTHQKEQGE